MKHSRRPPRASARWQLRCSRAEPAPPRPRPTHYRRHPRHPRHRLLPPPSPPLPVHGARPGRLVHVRPPLLRLLGQERKPPSPRCQSPRTAASRSRPTTAGLPRPPPVARSGERTRARMGSAVVGDRRTRTLGRRGRKLRTARGAADARAGEVAAPPSSTILWRSARLQHRRGSQRDRRRLHTQGRRRAQGCSR